MVKEVLPDSGAKVARGGHRRGNGRFTSRGAKLSHIIFMYNLDFYKDRTHLMD
jgi:hypothetical protein